MKNLLVFMLIFAVASIAFAEGDSEEPPTELPAFTVLNGAEPSSLDASYIRDTASVRVHLALFENLLSYDPETNRGIPGVAESWSVSEDGLIYTFNLRDSTWSDGTPITAQTVVDSWLRTLDPETESPYAWMIGLVIRGATEYNTSIAGPEAVGIEAINDLTFRIELTESAPYVLDMLPHTAFGIFPLHVIEQYGEEWTMPERIVSNGPFVLDSWLPDRSLTVIKNKTYWDAENVALGRISFVPSSDDKERYDLYMSGEADWVAGGLPGNPISALRSDHHVHTQFATYYFEFNHSVAPLGDSRVRKALSMAIDRNEITDNIELLSQDPYTQGWMVKIKASDPQPLDNLMTASDYEEYIDNLE